MGGPQLRIANSIIALNQICNLSVLSRHSFNPDTEDSLRVFVKDNCRDYFWVQPYYFNLDGPLMLQYGERILRKIYDPRKRKQAQIIEEYVKRNNIRVVWFGFGNISLTLIRQVRRRCPNLKIVCDTDSVWSRFVLRAMPFSTRLRKPYVALTGFAAQRREIILTQISHLLTAVSEIDLQFYQNIAQKKATIMRFSNVVNMQMYDLKEQEEIHVKRPAIYLAGTFGHKNSPMDHGCMWFLNEVLPLVKRTIPNVHLYIAGSRSIERFGRYASQNVTVLGRLNDLVPYLSSMDISIVPLFFESGTRFKILEAAICGIPVISTTLGVEGLDLVHEQDLLIADSAQDFSESIVKIIGDQSLRLRLTTSCRQKVENSYVIKNLMQEGQKILDYLVSVP